MIGRRALVALAIVALVPAIPANASDEHPSSAEATVSVEGPAVVDVAEAPEVPVADRSGETTGRAAVRALGDDIHALADEYGVPAAEIAGALVADPTLRVADDRVLVADAAVPPGLGIGGNVRSGPYDPADTFVLHSRPGATSVIYLDVTGHTTEGTQWNTTYTAGDPILSAAFSLDSDPTTFTTDEHVAIQTVWQIVAEDFAPFEVDVTTEEPAAEVIAGANALRVVVSPTNFYNVNNGGVAYLWSFGMNVPAFCFTDQLGPGMAKFIGECVSHETGHTLGLAHDGRTSEAEYHAGDGAWAPIMGNSYLGTYTQWSKGEYTGASNTEDDLSVIADVLTSRPDDHGDWNRSATRVTADGATAGVIGDDADIDTFLVVAPASGSVWATVAPSPGSNLRMHVTALRNGEVVSDRIATGSVAVPVTVSPDDRVVLSVEGVGDELVDEGFTGYGSIGQYDVTWLLPDPLEVSANVRLVRKGPRNRVAVVRVVDPAGRAVQGSRVTVDISGAGTSVEDAGRTSAAGIVRFAVSPRRSGTLRARVVALRPPPGYTWDGEEDIATSVVRVRR